MKLCIAYMMYITILSHSEIDNYLTNFRSILTFCYFFTNFLFFPYFSANASIALHPSKC